MRIDRLLMVIFIIVALLLTAAACLIYVRWLEKTAVVSTEQMITILLDAGHGGADPGKPGSIKNEDEINLAITKKLSSLLREKGFVVILIREDDSGVFANGSSEWDKASDMAARKEMISSVSADVLVSIHCNSFTDSSCRGAQVFYPPGNSASEELAKIMQLLLADIAPFENTRQAVCTSEIRLLNDNPMPSVMAECGFLSNPLEDKLLAEDEYQQMVAQAIFEAICSYYALTY